MSTDPQWVRKRLADERTEQLRLRSDGKLIEADQCWKRIDRLLELLLPTLPVTSGVTMRNHGDSTG